jgi:hypothetical protein
VPALLCSSTVAGGTDEYLLHVVFGKAGLYFTLTATAPCATRGAELLCLCNPPRAAPW